MRFFPRPLEHTDHRSRPDSFRPVPEVYQTRAVSPTNHESMQLPVTYEKPLGKVKPPPNQRLADPADQFRYALDPMQDTTTVDGTTVSRYPRVVPRPSRLRMAVGGGTGGTFGVTSSSTRPAPVHKNGTQ